MTPHQRIMRNAKRGMGIRLSADEVFSLSLDDAIMTRALVDDEEDERSAAYMACTVATPCDDCRRAMAEPARGEPR